MKTISSLSGKISQHTKIQRQFQLVNVVVLILMTILLGVTFKYSIDEQSRFDHADKTVSMVKSYILKVPSSVWQGVSALSVSTNKNQIRRNELVRKKLNRLFAPLTALMPDTQFKLYNLDGIQVYSSKPVKTGLHRQHQTAFKKARQGSETRHQDGSGSGVMLAWLPIYDKHKVRAVLELQLKSLPVTGESKPVLNRVIMILFMAAMLLFAVTTVYMTKLDKAIALREQDIRQKGKRQEYLAYHDSLTGLPNRELFIDRLIHAAAKVDRAKEMLAVMFVDIDRFKLINDSLGYAAGNEVVKMVAERLRTAVRECDTIARVGGDEFTILLETISDPQEAVYVVNRIQSSLSGVFKYEHQEINLTASIGISIYPEDEGRVEELVNHADAAKDKAKKNGGGDFRFYTRDMNKSSWHRLEMERDLRHGLEKEQYLLHFQPKVDLIQGRITGMEALLRWQRTDDALVNPAEFIPMLEETGLIIEVGEWVLRESCRVARSWLDEGHDSIVMAVNVSARQFRQLDFVDKVYHILDETGLPPELLEIEVTEGILMEDTQASASTLEALKRHGIRIAIDDFGTGYSSLSYLQRYPIDTLKIDRAFVQDIENNNEGVAITTTIIALAHNLRLHIVAEGVETNKQLEFLTALGCHDIQGFLFSKPLPYEEFCELLKNESKMFSRVFEQQRNTA